MWLSIRLITPLQNRPGQGVEELSQASASPQSLLRVKNMKRRVRSDPASCFLLTKFGTEGLDTDELNPKEEKDTQKKIFSVTDRT